jgi:multicomponent Na+:H+ antiporter subunit F
MIFLSLIYLIYKKEIFIKIMLLNYISGLIILIISTMSLHSFNSSYIDIAIIYVLLSFTTSIGFLNYFKIKNKKKEKDE